jgi:hypothetical protein
MGVEVEATTRNERSASFQSRREYDAGMRLFVVQNHFQGEGIISCLVFATDENAAIELAQPKFEESAAGRYPERYWLELTAKPAPVLELFESDL